ncbi:MAG TPA: hypothetical protein VNJ03_01445 [Vicinamibacterales bacterium]|nr:hypothetical protein [Vicinamibacterales bacterium]
MAINEACASGDVQRARPDHDVLEDVLAELRALRALLEGSRKPLRRADGDRLARILPAVAGALGSHPFAVRDLFDDDSPALALVLTGMTTKSIAQLFSRGADQVIDGYVVQRAHRELNAQLWRVVRGG